jgi:ankyrin repeat protein
LAAPDSVPPAPTPLHHAVQSGDLAALQAALQAGTPVDARDAQGRTALMRAAERGDPALVRALLQARASRTLRDPQGRTAADLARAAGHNAVAPLLD